MVKTRRMGVETSKQRSVLIDAAEAILCDEGYTGISAANVAKRAGFTKQLVYYYFRTMDELILALVRRINDRRLEHFETALASTSPLRALWALNRDASVTVLSTELTAIAAHRDAVRAEVIASAQQFRVLQTRAVASLIGNVEGEVAAGMVMIASALSRIIGAEAALGLTEGHAEALKLVEKLLNGLCASDALPVTSGESV